MSDIILQLALIILPAGAVLMTTIYFLRREASKEVKAMKLEMKKQRDEFFLPHRMEAYQRAILLMERINPSTLTMRILNPALPARAMQMKLLETIREEYNHNVGQQMFISAETWAMVKKAKEESIKIINIAGNQTDAVATGMDLSAKIFEIAGEIGEMPTDITIGQLRKEFQLLY